MAQKTRVPNPPKRSQGPQRRTTPTDPAVAAQRRRTLLLVGAGAILVAAAILGFVLLSGGGAADERQAIEDAGGTLQSFAAVKNAPDHSDVPSLTTKPKTWNSSPPTSGPHWGVPAIWDFYDTPVPLVQTVHNLEHGGVVIHYGPQVPEAEVERIREFWVDDPNGLVVAPLPANKDKITLSAWTVPDNVVGTADRGRGWLATFPRFDEDAFSAFVDEHRYKGPERLDPASLSPGS
jgi:Protein of unknown function (DUF3105)